MRVYQGAHPGETIQVANGTERPTISTPRDKAFYEDFLRGTKYLGAKVLTGIVKSTVAPVNYLNKKFGLVSDAEHDRIAREIDSGKGIDLGLNHQYVEHGPDSKILSGLGSLAEFAAPAILSSESGGAAFYANGIGSADLQVQKLKDSGVKFNKYTDDLYIQGYGILNWLLMHKLNSSVFFSKLPKGVREDVVGNLSLDAVKTLSDKGVNATANDVAEAFINPAMNFNQRVLQYGLKGAEKYMHTSVDLSALSTADYALKEGVNKLNDKDVFTQTPADLLDQYKEIFTSTAPIFAGAGLVGSAAKSVFNKGLGGALRDGILFNKSPYKNAVVDVFQRDASPESVERVKNDLTNIGHEKGWTDDEISNSLTSVDAIADVANKLPHDLPQNKFNDATDLVLGRRQLEAVLEETRARKADLDPAIADKAAPFEALLNAKIEQANDKLDELITDKSYTYTEDGGKYYKSKLGEDPIEISKDRYDLEVVENKGKPKAQQSLVTKEPESTTKTESKPKAPEPVAETAPTLDDLDSELEAFKQEPQPPVVDEPVSKEPVEVVKPVEKPEPTKDVTKKPESIISANEGKLADDADEKMDKVLKSIAKIGGPAGNLYKIQTATLSIADENDLLKSNKEYRDLMEADEAGTLDEDGKNRMTEIYKKEQLVKQINVLRDRYNKAKESGNDPEFVKAVESALVEPVKPKTEIKPKEPAAIYEMAKPYVDEENEPVKKGTPKLFSEHTFKDGTKIALILAKTVHGDDIAAVKQLGPDGKMVIGDIGNGWKVPSMAKEDFEYYLKKHTNEQTPKNISAKAPDSVAAKSNVATAAQAALTPVDETPKDYPLTPKHPRLGDEVDFEGKPYKISYIMAEGKELKYRMTSPDGKELWTNEPAFTSNTPMGVRIGKHRITDEVIPEDRPYYVSMPDGHKETPGKAVPNDHGLDLFVHNLENINGKGWGVSEGSTGLSLSKGKTEAEAIANVQQILKTKTPAEIQAAIKKQHENGLQSPRGITQSTNTESIETAITEATATIAEAETTSGGDPESAGVIDAIDKSIEKIDSELTLAGYYDTTGETDKDITERGSNRPEKNFKTDLVKFSKELAKTLGYEHDTLTKGKKTTAVYANTNVPPAGGDGSIILWKPNSKFGVYISVSVDREYPDDNLTIRPEFMWRVVTPEDKYGGKGNQWVKSDINAGDLADQIKKEVDSYDKTPEPEPEPEPTNEPPKDEKKSKREKYAQDLKDAKKAFMDTFNKALSGINPETIEKGIKLISVYAKIGIHDFKEIARDLAADVGEQLRDIFEGLKASYGAYATQEASDAELDLMTDIREVRKATIDDYIPKIKENESRTELNTLEKDTSGVDARQSTAGITGTTPEPKTEKVSNGQNDRGGEHGNENKPARQNEPDGSKQPDSGNGVSAGESGTGRGPGKSDTGSDVSEDTAKRVIKPEDRNHIIEPNDVIVPSGAVAKFNANVDALFLLKKLEAQNRNPTVAEKKALAQFVGWGGLAKYLNTPNYKDNDAVAAVVNGKKESMYNSNYQRVNLDFTNEGPIDFSKYDNMNDLVADIKKQLNNAGYSISPDDIRAPLLKSMLSNAEYQDAQNSTVTAYYTQQDVIKSMWNIVKQLGFVGGRVTESSAGIGHILGMLPKELVGKAALTGYELDNVTGRLLKKLYPQANITVGGFEAARTPQNSQDLVITNVPFGPTAPYDKNFPELSKFSLHNYFIAKNLKLLKPGGIGVIITSSSTMDSPSSAKFREWVVSPEGGNSYLVGAIRLPNNVFDENAGTQVTSDLLVFQKKGQVVDSSLEQSFRYAKTLRTGTNMHGAEVPIDINEYYIDHPENMLGEMMTVAEAGSGNRYGDGSTPTLKAPDNFNLEKALSKVEKTFPKDIVGNRTEPVEVVSEPITAIDKKEGSLFVKDNKIYKVEDGDGKPVTLDAKQTAIAKAYVDLKDGLLNLIRLEQSDVNAEDNIEAQRKELNKDYDAFVKKHGNVNGRATNFLNDSDIDFPIVSSLENIARSINEKGNIIQTVTKGEILNKRINFPRIEPTTAADIKDAINVSLNYRNGLDLAYMGRMLGKDVETVKEELLRDGLAYENPDTGILETPEEYLSGYVREKLRKAEVAAVNDPSYKKNVAELKKIIPEDIPASLISYSLGSAWIPAHVYEAFAEDIFGGADVSVKYLDKAGKFLTSARQGRYNAEVTNSYAAGGLNGIEILEATLNNRQIVVTDTVFDEEGKKRQVKNVEKTAAAQAMQATMQERFEEFVNGSEEVQRETERIYNDVFNGQVLRNYRIPEFKNYPGASTVWELRQHQKRAVSRGLYESFLGAHEVGSGKTLTIITTAMEMRRLGLARKPLIGVQNSTLGDFVATFKTIYPAAKILAPTEKEMQADGRKKLFAKIATGDWDAIILPHSQVTMIPDDPERQKAYIREQIEEMKETMLSVDDRREANKFKTEIKKLEEEINKIDEVTKKSGTSVAKSIGKKSLSITAQMEKLMDRKVDNILNFEQLGIDAMLMDEAHKYKRLGFQTSMQNIKGIDTSRSQRSQSVLLKARWIQEKTGGRNVSFYTGTPISNTMAEAWTMMKYLRPDILQRMGIDYFDQFAKTFGQVIPSLEQTGGGTFKIQSRFAKFQNLPEFINAFRAVTDVVLTEDVKEFQNTDTIPKLKDGKFTQVILPQSPELKKQIQEFKQTLEWFDRLSGKEKKENSHIPLVIYNKAKQASIDLRLLNPSNVDSPASKVNRAVENALKIYKDTAGKKGVQMIFSDMYQSPEPKNQFLDEDGRLVNPAYGKERFNLFEDIKKKLVAKGVPADEIVIFTESKYDKSERKKAVFADANSGKIRFMLGTTERMGVGVNAQQKLVALHHLDAPARPMDFEQRNGRIIRQGNENKEVDVLTYGVEKTLDSAAFQRLATKQKFINQIMKGENLERVTEDPADEAQMTFDEMMAHLSDSPYAMQKLMVDNKLSSERMKQQNFNNKIIRTNSMLRQAESNLRADRAIIADEVKFADIARKAFPDGNITSLKIGDKEVSEKFGEAADAYIKMLIDKFNDSPTNFAKGGFWLNGVRVELEIRNEEQFSKQTNLVVNTPDLHYTMPEIGLLTNSYGNPLRVPSNTGSGLLSSIRGQMDYVLVRPAETQAEIIRAEKNIEQLKKDAATRFDDSKIKALEEESEALKAKMMEAKKPDGDEPPDGDGAQTTAEYIKDQSNIKPALDFLDNMKAKNDGKFLSTIVPIPPAVWNGAIDVMKNILKATNSTQKAIRVAAKYIIDRGGTDAQAKDFENTMTEKMANTATGKRANVADTDESSSEEVMIKAARDLQAKLNTAELTPTEKDFAAIDVSSLTKKELHRYVEVAAVLSVDATGVPQSEITDLFDRVNNRVNPRSGTAVPPAEPPIPPTGENGNLMDDDEPAPRRTIPRREKLPMEAIEDLDEQTDESGKPRAKENYSAFGRLRDIRVRNLSQLKEFSEDINNMAPLRDVRQYATSKSQASMVMKTATDRIVKLVGKAGWDLLREALVESRLRGIRQRWSNWANQIKQSSDNEIDDLFEEGNQSIMYDLVSGLDGYDGDPKPEQTILGLISNGEYDDAREYLSDIFANAALNVARFDKLSNGKGFDEIVNNGQFVDPKMQEALEAYKSLMETPFKESHASNEGVFSDALGPFDTYYPLSGTGKSKHFIAGTPKYKAPENPNNKFATGQGDKYSTAMADLSNKLSNAIRTNNKANAIKSLEQSGLIVKVNRNDPDHGYVTVNGQLYTATKVKTSDSMLVSNGSKSVHIPAHYVMMPTWLYNEVKPIFEDSGDLKDNFSLFGRINDIGIKVMLGGPIEATSHSYRLLGGIVNSMPYMQEWAYKNGILGHAGGLLLNNPFVKTFVGMGKILFTDISSEEALTTIQEMAKIGVIPEKTWQKTWSKEFAELTGAKKVPIWDFSPILYGKGTGIEQNIDLRSRVLMYRLSKAMNPEATPEQLVTMQNELGNYTTALQGEMEKFVKKHGLAPFYSFGGAIYRSGLRAVWGGSHLPLTRPSLKEAFTTKQGAEQMAKLATYKMAQLLSAGIVGLLAYWALTYHAQTDKWPWEDKHSKLLKIPFPKQAKNPTTKKLWADKKTGEYPDVDFSFFNPFLNRGIRAAGLPKAYESEMLGGSVGQSIEAGTIQAINTNLSPYTSSPAIQMGVTGLTGSAPYITSIRDKFTGTPGIGFYRKANTFAPGLQIPANLAVSATSMNPLLDAALSPVTGALKYKYGTEDMDAYSAAQSVFNTIIPHLLTPHGNDEGKEKAMEKQQKAINTSMKKEAAKRH